MELDFPKMEKEILEFWEKNKIFEKLRKKNEGKKRWSFLDGPITANNPMGVHHAWGRTYKDVFQRYKAMKGYDQRFQNGFDCQGLWVEVEVEKEKGFKSKKDIEKYGIEKFVEDCKARVIKFSKIQTQQSIRLGQWMDWGNSYYTMSDENNYAIWYFLKKCWKKGLLYKGRDVVPWCPRCGTAISQHEILTEEYKEVWHKSIFLKLLLAGRKNTYFLVWTTTPWTLPANVALAVHPDLEYAKIKTEEGIFILLKSKSNLIPNGKIVKTFKGKELKDIKYQGPFDELPAVKKSLKNYKHKVILWEEVSQEEGTGIVHIAPGCGEEDFQLSKEFNLPIIDPTNEESKYKKGFGVLSDKFVTSVNELIFNNLEKKGIVFKIEDYKHRYPHCWRCKSELIFRLVDEWYIAMDPLRKPLMEIAKKIKWIPSFGLERELDWLKNMKDWLISKKRYWGLALPIYECKCGNFEVIGSREELKERAVEGWDEFDGHTPHRPWIDKVKIRCSKCGRLISRIPDVGNPWLDAGIVPYSTLKYFSDREYWKKWFPADLVCESLPGQFKNWFYSLLVMSLALEGKAPVKTIFGYATVVDEKGEEMHKSKGNAIWFDEAVEKIGADVMRWMYVKQNPIYNLRFGFNVAREVKRKILTLWNSYIFFKTYVSPSEIETLNEITSKSPPKNPLDKWIISKLNTLIEKINKSLDKFNAQKASSLIEDFFIKDLSLWYIRCSRERLQKPKNFIEKRSAASVLYTVLINLSKLIAPMMPFLSERMYQGLRKNTMPISIHLCDYPETEKRLINRDLEKKMEEIRKIVSLALRERQKAKIKVRQPLSLLEIKNAKYKISKELKELIKKELNVKKVKISVGRGELKVILDTKITPSLLEEGILREIIRHIQALRKGAGLKKEDIIEINYIANNSLSELINKNIEIIKKETIANNVLKIQKPPYSAEKRIIIINQELWIGIKKIDDKT
jgi:isoleucyl-tRNA synthetase